MEITPEELRNLDESTYHLIDIRSSEKTAYGIIPGAVCLSVEELIALAEQAFETTAEIDAPNDTYSFHPDKSKKLILYCDKGLLSVEPAEKLRKMGYDAVSLTGGYIAWVLSELHEDEGDFAAEVEQNLRKKFRKSIWCKFTKAVNKYELVKEGDRIAVCISGGKDSMLMAKLFQELKRHGKFPFEMKFLVMDPGYSPENRKIIENNAKRLSIPIEIFESDIFDAVYTIEKSPCYLCARMRRGHLYAKAQELGCNKIALGHHYDDVIETILMGMLYGGQVQTMMPKLHSTNFEGMELIRPMYLIREDDIKRFRDFHGLHFLQCACRFTDTCSTGVTPTGWSSDMETGSKRLEVKALIAEMKKSNPFVEANIFKSVENVNLNTIIAYKKDGEKYNFLDKY